MKTFLSLHARAFANRASTILWHHSYKLPFGGVSLDSLLQSTVVLLYRWKSCNACKQYDVSTSYCTLIIGCALYAFRNMQQDGEEVPRPRPKIHPLAHYEICNRAPCTYGLDCTFAHSEEELHDWFQSRAKEEPRLQPTKEARPPYQMCKDAENNGYCQHDVHCNFAHSKQELETWTRYIT